MTRPSLPWAASFCAAASLPAALATGQAWQIPERGAARYERQTDWTVEPLDGQDFTSSGGHADRVPPLLFGPELSRDGRSLLHRPFDLHAIGPFLAFDRPERHRGRVTEQLPMVYDFGDVTLRGTVEPLEPGVDRITVEVSRRPARPADAALARSMEHYMSDTVEGEITVDRTWDEQRGAVGEFVVRADLRYTSVSGSDPYRYRRTGSERWVLQGFRTGDDAGFREEVNDAIDAARDYLLEQIEDPQKGAVANDEVPGPVHGPALLARMLRALAEVGVPREDSVVARALDDLAGREMRHPRALSEAILALAAFAGNAVAEREQTRARGEYPSERRRLATADRRQLEVWTQALLEARDRAFEPPEILLWGFHSDHRDHAHLWQTTRAVEALLVADRCGVRIPRETWDAAANGVLADQFRLDDGGWCDRGFEAPNVEWSQGHTTAAAVAALRGLRARVSRRMRGRVDAAVDAGIRWLGANFEARFNPSAHPVFWQHAPEWCEALPAALERCGIEELNDRDWYYEMAEALLVTRSKGGRAGTTVAGTPAALSLWRRTLAVPRTGPATVPETGPETGPGRTGR